jgi:hypothetical protein
MKFTLLETDMLFDAKDLLKAIVGNEPARYKEGNQCTYMRNHLQESYKDGAGSIE